MEDTGNEDKSFKMSSAQMQERIRILHPSRFTIPIMYHIGSYVTSYRGTGGKISTWSEDDEEQQLNFGRISVRYVQYLDAIVRGNIKITHLFIESTLREAFGIREGEEPDEFPNLNELVKRCAVIENES